MMVPPKVFVFRKQIVGMLPSGGFTLPSYFAFLYDCRSAFLFVYAERGLPISPASSTLLSPQTLSLSQRDSPSMC